MTESFLRDPRSIMRPLGTLRGRLILVLGAIVVGISVSVHVWVPQALERQANRALEDKARAIASVTAFTVRSPLEFGLLADVQEDLDRMTVDQGIEYLRVVGPRGTTTVAEAGTERTGTSGASVLRVSAPIVSLLGDTLGVLELGISTEPVAAEVIRLKRSVEMLSFLVLVLGISGAIMLGIRLTRPISDIVTAAEHIAQGNLSERVGLFGFEEVDRLARSFNRMVDQLQSSQTRLAEILDGLPAPVAVFDTDFQCVYYNAAATGPGRSDLDSRPPMDPARFWDQSSIPADVAGTMQRRLRDALEQQAPQSMEVAVPGEPERIFLMLASPFGHGTTKGIIGYGADITELRQAEDALTESRERLHQAQKMEAVGRLAGGIAHDFNNLLTVIGGHVQLLQEDSTGTTADQLAQVAASTDRAAALTAQLLAFSRKQVVHPTVFRLDTMMEEVQTLVDRLIGEDIEVITRLEAGTTHVRIDRGQLEQVVMNLAVNARDAMPEGGTVTMATLGEGTPEEPYGVLEVTDTGCGMDGDTRARAFEPFFTTKDVGQGTGLGLSTVYGIVTDAEGSIEVESALGRGTTITVRIPAQEPEIAPGPMEEDVDVRGSETIVVVEDEPTVRSMVCRMLEVMGYTVLAARSSTEALDILDHLERKPDLLLTDVVMPGMSGRRLSDEVRNRGLAIPILFMSGYTDDQVLLRGVSTSDEDFLQKPFKKRMLAQAVRAALDRSRAPDLPPA